MASALSDRQRIGPVPLRVGMSPEEIYAAYGLTCPPRVGTLRNPARKTYGVGVARIAAQLGQPLMPWQRYAVDTALEVDPDTGWLVYRDVTLVVPRQSGKTTLILSVKAHRALKMGSEALRFRPSQGPRQFILYAAQKLLAARRKFVEEHLPVLQASPLSSRFTTRLANGSESVLWDTGALDSITANTETSGHGPTLDLGVEDEFWAAVDHRLEQAFSPAMLTRWSPQHWRVSTEGTEASTYMATKVELGRLVVASGEPTQICYLEWSNLDGPRDAPATWLTCMPALCPTPGECDCSPTWRHTVTLDTVAGELEKFKTTPDEFDRAYLNRRKGSVLPPDPNVPPVERWNDLIDIRQAPGDLLAFGIACDWQGTEAAIVAAWPGEGPVKHHLRVIEYKPGVDWLPDRCAELDERWTPVAWGVDLGGGPTKQLKQPLLDVEIELPSGEPKRGDIASPLVSDSAAYTATLLGEVRAGTMRHEGQDALTDAYKVARTKPSGDVWLLDRKASGNVICLQAAISALFALETRKHLADDYDVADSFG
ncbi:hypothetical protein [Micromonospora humidisoli]|uniref:Terminase n=1 Tax=Micromonospora humidisoli TaxID=2807622 RepID=A0ABS2JAS3_9ACTN|nr:hypothetical protein [Micromonospora humidisoli]MBM7083612.1 hypothetical protein [Micromonospora humidisoli]